MHAMKAAKRLIEIPDFRYLSKIFFIYDHNCRTIDISLLKGSTFTLSWRMKCF